MTAGLQMLAGTSRPVGENQAKKRKHRTEVSEATEKVWPLGRKCSPGTEARGREPGGKGKASHRGLRGHREGMAGGREMLAGTPRLAGREPDGKEKASHRGLRGHREGVVGGPKDARRYTEACKREPGERETS
jgi:hypothetical protein